MYICYRCIPQSQRAFGLGVKWVFIRFMGSVPGPIIFGALFDSTCMLWQDKCDTKGSCWIYNNYKLSWRIFTLTICLKTASLFFYTLAHTVYRPPPEKEVIAEREVREDQELNDAPMDTVPVTPDDSNNGFDNPQFKVDEE